MFIPYRFNSKGIERPIFDPNFFQIVEVVHLSKLKTDIVGLKAKIIGLELQKIPKQFLVKSY